MEVIVKTQFHDKDDFSKVYNPGDDVSHLGAERITDLTARGIVETKGDAEKAPAKATKAK